MPGLHITIWQDGNRGSSDTIRNDPSSIMLNSVYSPVIELQNQTLSSSGLNEALISLGRWMKRQSRAGLRRNVGNQEPQTFWRQLRRCCRLRHLDGFLLTKQLSLQLKISSTAGVHENIEIPCWSLAIKFVSFHCQKPTFFFCREWNGLLEFWTFYQLRHIQILISQIVIRIVS